MFLSKELLQVPFAVFKELKFFPLREFCKERNKWKSEGAMSGEYGGWIRTSQPSCNSFCLVIKETWGLAVFQWKITHFLLTNYRIFLLGVAFSWSSWKLYLLELIVWFSKQLIIEEALPIPPFIQYQLLWMKTGLWCGWWWFILLAPWSLHSTLLYSNHFPLPVTIYFKKRPFSLHLSRE